MWELIVMWVKHSWPRHPKPSKMPKSQELWGLCPLWPPPGLCPRPTRGPYAAPLTPGENVQRSFKSMSTLFCCACWYSWCNFVCSFEISNACFPSYWFNWFLASECSDIGLMSELCYMFFSLMWRTPHLPNRKYHKCEGFSFKNYWRLLQQKKNSSGTRYNYSAVWYFWRRGKFNGIRFSCLLCLYAPLRSRDVNVIFTYDDKPCTMQ